MALSNGSPQSQGRLAGALWRTDVHFNNGPDLSTILTQSLLDRAGRGQEIVALGLGAAFIFPFPWGQSTCPLHLSGRQR